MTFHFSTLILPEFSQLTARELLRLAGSNNDESGIMSPALADGITNHNVKYPRSLDEIFQDIEQGNTQNLSSLEWIHCINLKKIWEQKNQEKSNNISENIWNFAKDNPWLKHYLFWNLVLHYSQSINCPEVSNSLLEQFTLYVPQTDRDRCIVKIIKSLQDQNNYAYNLAKISLDKLQTPRQLFANLDLPQKILEINHALDKVCSQFINSTTRNNTQVTWLINCLEEMNKQRQVNGVNLLLENISREDSIKYPELVNWIKQYSSPSLPNSFWNQLSSSAKKSLCQWMGAANYQDFQQLIQLILQRLYLEDWKKNQLERRKDFWWNYCDRFERIRILLPPSSAKVLSSDLGNQNTTILKEDGSEMTEVCIFDFGQWLIVEFFRGRGSEIRLFPKTPELEKKLFEDDNLCLKKLRFYGGETHDHVFCWQGDCVQWLRQREIYPNEGTIYFKGLPRQHCQYNPNRGLPAISPEDRRKRRQKLRYWREDIQQLEEEARRWAGEI
ncbi:EH signature domain-containing protein [Crocosphaera sp. XPORK-15E]|uniref:EH signature domain-containing protein n=1 Tax=Crocosphaera sp. XPORK-15E TaxID=3110247 RepID=UPI002B214686|nr:EH signature domain-containing protein [Crocosphaera sp. XPORK-15E]MEA5535983.1 EH signature domain-containing protein [Crocosphaera sp. XPORK-15E]